MFIDNIEYIYCDRQKNLDWTGEKKSRRKKKSDFENHNINYTGFFFSRPSGLVLFGDLNTYPWMVFAKSKNETPI